MAAHMTEAQKNSKYFKIFYGLIALTALELAVLYLPIPQTLIAILVGIFSASKAVVVGYYYMHLEYETRWLKIVVCIPVIAFGYAFFLVLGAKERPVSIYSQEAERTHAQHNDGGHAPGIDEAAAKADAWLKSTPGTGEAQPAAAQETSAADAEAADSGRPAGAPAAVEGVDNWR